jgi:hypothetical protein
MVTALAGAAVICSAATWPPFGTVLAQYRAKTDIDSNNQRSDVLSEIS